MIILTYIQQTGGDRVKYETNKRVTQTVNSTIFSYDTAAVPYVVVVVVVKTVTTFTRDYTDSVTVRPHTAPPQCTHTLQESARKNLRSITNCFHMTQSHFVDSSAMGFLFLSSKFKFQRFNPNGLFIPIAEI